MRTNGFRHRLARRRGARNGIGRSAAAHRFEARLESSAHARRLVILSGALDSYGIETIRVAAARDCDAVHVRVFSSPRGDIQALHDTCERVEGQLAALGRRGVRIRVTSA